MHWICNSEENFSGSALTCKAAEIIKVVQSLSSNVVLAVISMNVIRINYFSRQNILYENIIKTTINKNDGCYSSKKFSSFKLGAY